MISEDCGVHSGVGGRISYESAEALIPILLSWTEREKYTFPPHVQSYYCQLQCETVKQS